jgi:DnaJ-class molecular chaperone
MERWGAGSHEQTLRGYELPEPRARAWWDVLGVARDAPIEVMKDAYRELVKQHHPDRGGNPERMAEIHRAWAEAQIAKG